MYEALLVVFPYCGVYIGLIMLQQGKGADMGASFRARRFHATLFWFKWFW